MSPEALAGLGVAEVPLEGTPSRMVPRATNVIDATSPAKAQAAVDGLRGQSSLSFRQLMESLTPEQVRQLLSGQAGAKPTAGSLDIPAKPSTQNTLDIPPRPSTQNTLDIPPRPGAPADIPQAALKQLLLRLLPRLAGGAVGTMLNPSPANPVNERELVAEINEQMRAERARRNPPVLQRGDEGDTLSAAPTVAPTVASRNGSPGFDRAFAAARKSGQKVFEYGDKRYTTELRRALPSKYDLMPFGEALRAGQADGQAEIPWKGQMYKVAFR
jgi:hypothetical protein